MKILITGSNGFIGSALLRALDTPLVNASRTAPLHTGGPPGAQDCSAAVPQISLTIQGSTVVNAGGAGVVFNSAPQTASARGSLNTMLAALPSTM